MRLRSHCHRFTDPSAIHACHAERSCKGADRGMNISGQRVLGARPPSPQHAAGTRGTASFCGRANGARESAQGGPSPGECCPGTLRTPTALRKKRALNGSGRACSAGKGGMQSADLFAASPALLQSAALSDTARCHQNPGLARSSQRPGLTPAGRWPTPSTAMRLTNRHSHPASFSNPQVCPPMTGPRHSHASAFLFLPTTNHSRFCNIPRSAAVGLTP